jgi:predicted Zn-dependent protease
MGEVLSFERQLLERGARLAGMGQNREAKACLEHLLNLPEIESDVREQAYRLIAEAAFAAEDYRRARRYYAAALILEPTDAETHFRMARAILLDAEASVKRAWNHLNLAIAIRPGVAKYWSLLAQAALRLNRRQEAGRCFRKCLALKPTDPALLDELALSLAEWDKPAEAEMLLRRAKIGMAAGAAATLERNYRMHEAIRAQRTHNRPVNRLLPFPEVDRPAKGDRVGGILRFDRPAGTTPAPRLLSFLQFRKDRSG